jgi:hypothetical protein
MVSLTQEQRQLFMMWLDQGVATSEALATQMENLPMPVDVMAQKMRAEAAAQRIVSQMLSAIEVMTIE